MKGIANYTFVALLSLMTLNALAKSDSEIADSVGYVETASILSTYPDFKSGYDKYQPSPLDLEHIKKLTGKDLLVMFGTWCHDSQREIPRLLKLLDVSGAELNSFTMLAVDRNKQEPSGKADAKRLKYTPTIILSEGESELGRIVERPRVTLAYDLAAMLEN